MCTLNNNNNNNNNKNHAVYEIMWKDIVEQGRPQMTTWFVHIACWIPKAANAHSGCVILIACPLQQWSHERDSALRYTYILCLMWFGFVSAAFPPCKLDCETSSKYGVQQFVLTGNVEMLLRCKAVWCGLTQWNMLSFWKLIVACLLKLFVKGGWRKCWESQ
jgi:hypothetical protein